MVCDLEDADIHKQVQSKSLKLRNKHKFIE